MRSQVEVLMVLVYCFRGEMIIQGKEDLKERVELLDLTSTKVAKIIFSPCVPTFIPYQAV